MAIPAEMHNSAPLPAAGRGWGNRMVAAAAGLGMFLPALDISVNVALPSITRDFNTDLQTVQWIIVAFIATRAGLVMGAGSFGDRFGLRPVYLFGVSAYLAAMVLIAFSPSLEIVVGFRVLQALGTGCLFAVSPALAARTFPVQRRGLGMGFTAASQALGMVAGTLGAGLLVRGFGWESVFLARVPFTLLALFLAVKFLKREERSSSGKSFDVAGAATLIAGVLCLVVALRLGRSAGWTSLEVLVPLALAPVFLAAFWRAEGRAVWPVLPRDLLRIRGVLVSMLSMFLTHLGVFVIWFIFPFYISGGLGRGPFSLGLMLATMALFNAGSSGFGGWLCDRISALPVGVTGLAVLAGGLAAMSFLDANSGLAQVVLRIAVVGTGLGLLQSAAYASTMSSVAPDRLGTASAALSLSQAFGTVLSVAVIGGLFALINERHLSELASVGLTAEELQGRAFILAFQDIFRLGAAIAFLGAVVFLLTPWRQKRANAE